MAEADAKLAPEHHSSTEAWACWIYAQTERMPTFVYRHLERIIGELWLVLREGKQEARDAAECALCGCLKVVDQREATQSAIWYRRFLEDTVDALSTKHEAATCAIAVLKELINISQGDGLDELHLLQAFEAVWSLREARHKQARVSALAIMPRLAGVASPHIRTDWMPRITSHLLATLHAGPEIRAHALLALGHTATIAGEEFAAFVPLVAQECFESLLQPQSQGKSYSTPTRRAQAPVSVETFKCLQMLAESHAALLEPFLTEDILMSLFQSGISQTLASTLAALALHLPAMVPRLRKPLIDAVCRTLTNRSFSEWESTLSVSRGEAISDASLLGNTADDMEHSLRLDQIELAIRTFGSFNWDGMDLLRFIQECVLPYLDGHRATIRIAAAVACCRLLAADRAAEKLVEPEWSYVDNCRRTHVASTLTAFREGLTRSGDDDALSMILERVLVVGVSDPELDVRCASLNALTPAFDMQLAQSGKWELVLLALNDETTPAREAAIQLLGRLAHLNPAHVLPALRTGLFDLLTEIKHSSSRSRREDAAHLLGQLVRACPQLVKPYAETIFRVLRPQLRDSAAALASFGELSVIAGSAVAPAMPQLLPQLLPLLQNQTSSHTRFIALRTMTQLLRATGYPSSHPDACGISLSAMLLSALLAMLGSERDAITRLELLRSLGTLGAPDPSTHMQIQLARQRNASAGGNGSAARSDLLSEPTIATVEEEPFEPEHPNFYPSVAFRALTRILCAAPEPYLDRRDGAACQICPITYLTNRRSLCLSLLLAGAIRH